jgi:hypothetical protein
MIKRPVDERFVAALERGVKTTTIQNKPWPVGVPIMLYAWSSKGDRSRRDLVKVMVTEVCRMGIFRGLDSDEIRFFAFFQLHRPLFESEGYESHAELCDWFRKKIERGGSAQMMLMRFRILDGEGKEV